MKNILYYPYIDLPRTDWTLRTLLYYENVGSIVPQEYFYKPQGHDPFMRELIEMELVTPIDPMGVLRNPWEATKPFLDHIENNKEKIKRARKRFTVASHSYDEFQEIRIHSDKFHGNIFHALVDMGLAKNNGDGWYKVEKKIADQMMKFLATIVGVATERLPTTDYIKPVHLKSSFATQKKRETILRNIIPFPEDIDLRRLQKFKERHPQLLNRFKNSVELIVLNPTIQEGSQLFDEHMIRLLEDKIELTTKMNESRFGNIIFGTICGIIGAYQGLATASTVGAFVGGAPGFVNAIHSALQIERLENIPDPSGLKYLALAEKKLIRTR